MNLTFYILLLIIIFLILNITIYESFDTMECRSGTAKLNSNKSYGSLSKGWCSTSADVGDNSSNNGSDENNDKQECIIGTGMNASESWKTNLKGSCKK